MADADSTKRTTLIPVTDRAFAERLVGWMLGGIDLHDIPLTRPPRTGRLPGPTVVASRMGRR